jgi:arginyl-tRNA synthetase
VAEELASGLVGLPWVSAARVTGEGYLTITVTAGYLAGLAARIAVAGQTAANSDALAGRQLTASARPDLSLAASWEQAWQVLRDTLTGHMARAAGAEVLFHDSQQDLVPSSTTQAGSGSVPVSTVMSGGVAEAVAFHGADAVSYALARASAPRTDSIIRQFSLPLDMDNPFVLVRYAHADAASTLRWAGDLGLLPRQEPDHAATQATEPMQPELALLNAMSWLPERVAAAARRRRPSTLAAHLEYLAQAWLNCREFCPALPFLGSAAPGSAEVERTAARLYLADGARAAMSCGLRLLGIGAPERM